jgi:hypothetical protein
MKKLDKKALYENIMKDISKIVKSKLNESLKESLNESTVAQILQDRADDRGEEEPWLSIDEWLNDWNIFDDNARNAIIDVIEAIADGDDPEKYSELAAEYWG